MSEKEPGQAYLEWEDSEWVAAEAAIRADERAKVIEECAKAVEAMIDRDASDHGDRADMALMDAVIVIRSLILRAKPTPPSQPNGDK